MRCQLSILLAVITMTLAAVTVSCGGGENSSSVCDPGTVQTCPCGGGLPDGTQVCSADGSAWGECDCGADTDTDSDTDTDNDSDTDSDSDGGTDECQDVTCDDPPDDECQTDGTMHDYDQEAQGICIDGECIYEYETVTCDCDGTCAYDESEVAYCTGPCDDFVCEEEPPDDECLFVGPDAPALITYYLDGCTFDDDCIPDCYWNGEITSCPVDCAVVEGDDYCFDPCEGIVCDTPPDDYCEPPYLYVYEAVGECVDGDCIYDYTEIACPGPSYDCITVPDGDDYCADG